MGMLDDAMNKGGEDIAPLFDKLLKSNKQMKEEREVNFVPFGSTMLIEVGKTVSKGGILMPDQARGKNREMPLDQAYRVVSVTQAGLDIMFKEEQKPQDVDKLYVYMKPFADVSQCFDENGIQYALIEAHEVAGFAPDGFDLDKYTKDKEQKKKEEESLAQKRREDNVKSIITGDQPSSSQTQ